jgi:cobalt-zinc-cadmium efflux system protein
MSPDAQNYGHGVQLHEPARGHGAAHRHAHGHSHAQAPKDFSLAFALGVGLNLALVVGQIAGGLAAHSLALIADAGHNFADVLGLILAWWANRLGRTAPTVTHTYGLRSASILAAVANSVALLLSMGGVAWEAIRRFGHAPEVDGRLVMLVAAAGVVVNAVSAWPFLSGRKEDLNVGAAFQHLVADAGMSLGVIAAGALILFTGARWIDPVVSLVIAAVVVYGTWGLVRESLNMALQAVPPGIDVRAIQEFLAALPDVGGVHDLHVWAMSTTEPALTVHLVARTTEARDRLLEAATTGLRDRFAIGHVTVQIEVAKPIQMVFRGRRESSS